MIVVIAAMSGASYYFFGRTESQSKIQKNSEVVSDQTDTVERIKSILGSKQNCFETFGNRLTNASVTGIKQIVGGVAEEIFKTGSIGLNGIKITSLQLSNSATTLAADETALVVTISRGKLAIPDVVTKIIKLKRILNGSSQIQECYALSDSKTDWLRSINSPNDIYYNYGTVGAGSTTPEFASLTINGPMKVGSGVPCDSLKIGSLTYDPVTNQMMVCKSTGWEPLISTVYGPVQVICDTGSSGQVYSANLGNYSMCGLSMVGISNMGRADHWRGDCNVIQVGAGWRLENRCRESRTICQAICL